MDRFTKRSVSSFLLVAMLFIASESHAQNKVIDRKIQYFFSDYFGALDTGFTGTKNSSTTFLLDTAFSSIIVEHHLPRHKGWISSRLFNKSWVKVSGENYDITLDPYEGLMIGHETSINESVWHNDRGIYFNGRFGKKIKVHSYLQEGPIKPEPFIADYIRATRIRPGEGEVSLDGTGEFGRYLSFGGIEKKRANS